jgi:rubrerythrin
MPRRDLFPVLDPKAQRAGRKLAYRCLDCGAETLQDKPMPACPECEGDVELAIPSR